MGLFTSRLPEDEDDADDEDDAEEEEDDAVKTMRRRMVKPCGRGSRVCLLLGVLAVLLLLYGHKATCRFNVHACAPLYLTAYRLVEGGLRGGLHPPYRRRVSVGLCLIRLRFGLNRVAAQLWHGSGLGSGALGGPALHQLQRGRRRTAAHRRGPTMVEHDEDRSVCRRANEQLRPCAGRVIAPLCARWL